jgi:hypothetical protein
LSASSTDCGERTLNHAAAMFDHPKMDRYDIDDIPLDRDLYLRDAKHMAEYDRGFVEFMEGRAQDWKPAGYVTFVAGRRITAAVVELSWFEDIFVRFHSLPLDLPRDQIVACVGSWQCDEKPTIFVNGEWLESLYARMHCVFGMVDAIGVRDSLAAGPAFEERLGPLRIQLDAVASRFPRCLFLSFADSVIFKSQWTAGKHSSGEDYSYQPERMLEIYRAIRDGIREALGLDSYGILTQGTNAYPHDGLFHQSPTLNHISLNSLGAPFADLTTINETVRLALRSKQHAAHELYLEEELFLSLQLRFEYKKRDTALRYPYVRSLNKTMSRYVCASAGELLANLRPPKPAESSPSK